MVVSRAIIRDMFPPADAQRVMSQVTIYFGVAPAVAPMVGGWLFVHADWHAIFWFLAAIGVVLWLAIWRCCPRRCTPRSASRSTCGNLLRGYWQMVRNPRFLMLALASGIPFNGMFLYVLAAPVFLGEHLQLQPTQFFWFFMLTISGIMARRLAVGPAGRAASRRKHQIRHGFIIMLLVSLVNVAAEPAVHAARRLGAAADRGLLLRLGADGAGGDADGAGPGARAARHGLVGAGLHRQHGQRPGRRRDRAAGHAFDAWRWR